jgi:hypothetical protein
MLFVGEEGIALERYSEKVKARAVTQVQLMSPLTS